MATYRATLRGNQLEWSDEPPPMLSETVSVEVLIHTELSPVLTALRSRRMAAALERLASRGGPQGIADPVAWERDVRAERPLPDRE
jgi:hypothetical protein